MPRNYIRKKPELAPVTEQQIAKAKTLIERGKSKRAAANAIGISESCLRKRLKLNKAASSMGRYKPTFNESQEAEFAVHCKKMDERYFGLTINDLRRLAFEYASANKIENRFEKSSKMAGRDWVQSFLKRHPQLTLRQSTATSLARAIGFNKVQVDRFYKNLKELYEKHKFQPSRIYNVDETGISTVPKKTPKVITTIGKKVVSKVVSAERGITVTAICCMSATGHYIPPALIYPRKRPRDDLLDGGPSQSICMVSDSGFVNSELFVNWLHHFKYFVHPTLEDPVLLLLDNHSSHISLEVINYARDNNIVILTLPPHGSHKLQPLDRCLYSPLKVKYSIECDKFMAQHPGRGITQYQVAHLFNEAYKKVATVGNAVSGFKVTGIYPYDDDLFDEADFAPSFVTDQMHQDVEMEESKQPVAVNQPSFSDEDQNANNTIDRHSNNRFDQLLTVNQQEEIATSQIQLNRDNLSSSGKEILNIAPNNDYLEDDRTPSPSIIDAILMENICNEKDNEQSNCEPKTTDFEVPSVEVPETVNLSVVQENYQRISTEHVSVAQLSPLPRMKEKRLGSRVCMKSQVITASPYKQQLEEKKRQEKQKKKRNKTVVRKLSRQKPSTSKAKEKKYFCPLCQEEYTDPPIEEWIKCVACEEWWHELCTSHERGVFVCDNCSNLE
ncbi:unnamed protein product [Euphydryas editha]|uniref:DDE-1 domain-containing protein n=1 Tax=Euphydryas editha TaxID=104508 RepID=A0AAU9VA00_EUPED|nr:unnamed protein product [Euphydryas editha]